ncbi:sensor histidine kinase [Sediminitomix flava]|uniref:histidine kinase n=1 Tax=Sediminitomix flava TaxID=379075 RepID=A0A315ZE00_SEDFL|nr:cache domain-containing protein [Sediminitomix flava]PWJ42974.1 phospho-acceptor domain-containing protein [Sediminitomix flava]
MENNQVNIYESTLRTLLLASLCSILILTLIWSFNELQKFYEETNRLREDFIEEKKVALINEVDYALRYIEYGRKQNEEEAKKSIKERCYIGYDIVESIYEKYINEGRGVVIKHIKDVFSDLRYSQGAGYYFIDDLDGVSVFNSAYPELEGKNMINIKDKDGKYIVQDEIKIAEELGEGFNDYYWYKPNMNDGRSYKKFSYIKLFKPLGMIVGTGAYAIDQDYKSQKEILNTLSVIRFGDEGQIVVYDTLKGVVMSDGEVHEDPVDTSEYEVIGRMDWLSDSLKNQEGFFFTYYDPSFKQSEKKPQLLAYLRQFSPWNWQVAAVVSMDKLDEKIARAAKGLHQDLVFNLLEVIIIALCLISLLWWYIRKTFKKTIRNLDEFGDFFEKATNKLVKIDLNNLDYSEFTQLAKQANKMISDVEENQNALTEAYQEIQVSEEELRQQSEVLQQTNEHLEKVVKELKSTQMRLVNTEKLASLGQLTAGIAHEINNPINYITNNVQPLREDLEDVQILIELFQAIPEHENKEQAIQEFQQKCEELELDFLVEEIDMLLQGIKEGAERTKEIIGGMRDYSRMNEAVFKHSNIHDGLSTTLTLLSNRFKKANIEIETHFGDLPEIECMPGKLNQVFVNLLSNSVQAIENGGVIKITTALLDSFENRIMIEIEDNGSGIPEDLISKIYDPFFTTKDIGEGTGLGLSITHGIIEQHNGEIFVESKQGEDSFTKFTIVLPIKQRLNG